MIKKLSSNKTRQKRHLRIRHKVKGTPARPRLNVFRSNTQIYCQIIDDEAMKTIVSASSLDPSLKIVNGGNKEAAKTVGEMIAKKALEMNIKKVVFDRGGYLYHGRVKELAEAARSAGLEF